MYSNYDLDRLREFLPQYVEGITQRSTKGGRDMYNCPLCGSGTGSHGTGAFRLYRGTNTWFCFACQSNGGPNHGGDIFELIRQYEGIDGFNEQVQSAAAHAGITVEHERTDAAIDFKTPAEAARTPQNAAESPQRGNDRVNAQTAAERPQNGHSGQNTGEYGPQEEPPADYTQYFLNCEKNLETAADYLASRGLSLDTARRYRLGYDPQADPAGNPGGSGYSRHPETRLIIPVSKRCYVARSTNPATEPQYKKLFPKGSKIDIFNVRCLYAQDVQEVFITEGAIDALSIIETGRNAVALNSTSNTGILIDLLQQRPTKATLIICLDNDGPGAKAADSLRAGLNKLNISFIGADICGEHKDPNEHLTADRQQFEAAIAAAEQKAKRATEQAKRPDNILEYLKTGFDADRNRYKDGGISTGFKKWDSLTNGLHKGIYMLAATPGAGKTTLAWQICENLAVAGNDCLYFTLEQSKMDLLTKSIIRRIKLKDMSTGATIQAVKEGNINASAEQREIIQEIGNRISIIEGNFSLSAKDVCDYIEGYINRTAVKPIVFIDYLQALKPLDDNNKRRAGNREAIEDTTDLLSTLKNKYELTMIIVSSVSRANYRAALDIDALKESGRLEFSADAVYSLEFSCVYNDTYKDLFESDGDINKKKKLIESEKNKEPRYMIMKCIKSRYCNTGGKSEFKYYSNADLFIETDNGDFEPLDDEEEKNNPFTFRRREHY